MSRRLTGLMLLTLAMGCGKEPEDKVVLVADDDPAMTAAMQKAKETVLADFVPVLQKPGPGQDGFAIKYPVKDKEQVEHFWISKITFDGARFTGKLDNLPKLVGNVKLSQAMSIAPEEISDWMYIDNGKLVGGYTIRALRDRLQGQERTEFEQSIPFKID